MAQVEFKDDNMLSPPTPRQTERTRQAQAPIQRATSMHATGLTATSSALHYARSPIQRKPVAGTAQALPSGLRTGIESLSGMDMGAVRVHYASPLPARLSALAYAQGSDIHLARGAERHLPHEAWHIVQQRQGRVQPTLQDQGVPINDNPALEREADRMGAQAAQRKQADAKHADAHHETPASLPARPGVVQRYLIVGNVDHTRAARQPGANLDAQVQQVKNDMENAVSPAHFFDWTLERTVYLFLRADAGGLVTRQIRKWIEDNLGAGAPHSRNAQFGRKQQTRRYPDYHDLALAIYGWVSSKPGRREEKRLANEIYASPVVTAHINALLGKIRTWIHAQAARTAIIAELSAVTPATAHWADYAQWFNHVRAADNRRITPSFYPVLEAPGGYSMRDKIATFHDVMSYFVPREERTRTPGSGLLTQGAEGGRVAFNTFQDTTPEGRVRHRRPNNTVFDRGPLGGPLVRVLAPDLNEETVRTSREETNRGFIYARTHQIPMWGRQSFTAARMMRLAEQAGATHDELTATAYAITAFWRQDYDHRSWPYHTLHEVMDFRPHFGVLLPGPAYAYNPLNRYVDARRFMDPLTLLMPRLTAVANSPNWNNRARLHWNDEAPDSVIAIRNELGTAHTDVAKLLVIKNEIRDKTSWSLMRTSQARRFYTILAQIPDNVNHYQGAGTTAAVNLQIATRLTQVARDLNAFNP